MAISSGLGSSALLPAGLGFRNKIINGGFDINQRGFSSATVDASFGFDRWRMFTSDGTTTYSAQTFTLGNAIANQEPKNFARLATSSQTASTALSIFTQRIEDVRSCAGQQVTISFWAKTDSGTSKVAIELEQNFGSGGSPSSTVTNYCGQVTLTTAWTKQFIVVTVPSISGKTIGTASDSFISLNFWTSAGSSFNSRTGSLGIQNKTFDFWGVQLEQNYQPTPFEQRPIGVELALCQRYYESMIATNENRNLALGYLSYYGVSRWGVRFKQEKRAAPSVTTLSSQYWPSGSAVPTALTASVTGTTITGFHGELGGNYTSAETFYFTASAEL